MGFSDQTHFVRGIAYSDDLSVPYNPFGPGENVKIAGIVFSNESDSLEDEIAVTDDNAMPNTIMVVVVPPDSTVVMNIPFQTEDGLVITGLATSNATVFYYND